MKNIAVGGSSFIEKGGLIGGFIQTKVLVDLNNLQARIDEDFHKNPRARIPGLVLRLQQQVARVLGKLDSTVKYRAGLRIYHGWHQRRNVQPIRVDFDRFRFDGAFARRIGQVSYMPGFEYGNELCCYDEVMPIYDTYRGGGQEAGQKMVDTAISCDALHMGRFFPEMVIVIVSDDDDFLPAVITAKKWRTKCLLIRFNQRDLTFVTDDHLNELVYYWGES